MCNFDDQCVCVTEGNADVCKCTPGGQCVTVMQVVSV